MPDSVMTELKQLADDLHEQEKRRIANQIVDNAVKEQGKEIKEAMEAQERAQHPLAQIAEAPVSIWTIPRAVGWVISWFPPFKALTAVKEYVHAGIQGAPSEDEKELLRWRFERPEYRRSMTQDEIIRMHQPTAWERTKDTLWGRAYGATWMELLHDAGYNPYFAGVAGAIGEVSEAYLIIPRTVTAPTKAGKASMKLTEKGRLISKMEQAERIGQLRQLANSIPKVKTFIKQAKASGDKLGLALAQDHLRLAHKATAKLKIAENILKTRTALEKSGKALQPLGETFFEKGMLGQIAPLTIEAGGMTLELKSPAFYRGLNWIYNKIGLTPETVTGARAAVKETVTAFHRTTFDKKFDNYFTDYVNKQSYMQGKMTKDIKEIGKIRNQLAKNIYRDMKRTGMTKAEAAQSAEDLLTNMAEVKLKASLRGSLTEAKRFSILDDFRRKLSPEMVKRSEDAAELLKGINKKALQYQQGAGLDISPLGGDLDYLAHAITPEAYKLYNKSVGFKGTTRKAFSTWHSSMLQRKASAGMMITEWNKLVQEGKIPGLERFKGIKFFETDPVVIAHITAQRAARSASNYEFIRNIIKPEATKGYSRAVVDLSNKKALRELQIANPDYAFYIPDNRRFRLFPVDKIPAQVADDIRRLGMVEVTDDLLSQLRGITTKGIKAHLLPKHVAAEVGKTFSWANKQNLSQIGRYYDAMMDWLRAQALLSPKFHERNVTGGNIPNYLFEGGQPKHWIGAAKLQIGKPVDIISDTGKIYRAEEILELFERHGVRHTGWMASEAVPTRIKDMYRTSLNPFKRNFIAFNANRKLGTVLEDNARMALFMDGLEKAYEPVRAAARVDKALFTYVPRKLPETYKWQRRLAYFPRWTLGNMRFQIQKIFENPRAFRAYENISQGIGRMSAPVTDIDKVPDWILEAGAIPLDYDENGMRRYVIAGNYLSPTELKRLEPFLSLEWEQMGKQLLSQMSPLAKTALEQIIGKGGQSFFFGGPIEKFEGEKGVYLGLPMSKRLIHVLRNIRTLNDMDKYIFKDDKTGEITKALELTLGLSLPAVDEKKTKKWKEYQKNLQKAAERKARKKKAREARVEQLKEEEE